MSANDNISLSPVGWIKKLIVEDGMTFDHAFTYVSTLYMKQHNKQLPREKIAKLILEDLRKSVGELK